MRFIRYAGIMPFKAELFDVLMENELQNNLPISIITDSGGLYTPKWLLGAVKDDTGRVILAAVCTPPFKLLLCAAGNKPDEGAVKLLSDELKAAGYMPPGVMAEQKLARKFAAEYAGEGGYFRRMTLNLMRLDRIAETEKAPGRCRVLREEDMYFAPYWERAFSEDCSSPACSIEENVKRIKSRLGKDTHFYWEDGGMPVSQAVCGRETPAGAVINGVYTPPHFRGRGYASSVVAEMSGASLRRGKKYCCLFADAANPVSCGLYRKIGYRDICVFDDIKFLRQPLK